MAERDTRKRFNSVADTWAKRIAAAFAASMRGIVATTNVRDLTNAIDRRDIMGAVDQIDLSKNMMAPLDNVIAETFAAGGKYSVATLPARHPGTGAALVVNFQGRHERAEAWLTREAGGLITNILNDQRTMIIEQITTGLSAGRNPRSVALDLVGRVSKVTGRRTGGLIGLANNEAGYVDTLRRAISDPATASDYFKRLARDRRFDPVVRRSIATGKPLTQTQIDKITGRYSDRLLKLRADRIARTESIASLNAGRTEGMNQLIDTGAIPADAVTKAWSSSGDGRDRDTHHSMSGQSVGINEPFVSPSGARLMHPGDTSLGAGAAEVIQCRCWMAQRVDWLGQAA